MIWLGIDLGRKRIGVAASDELGWVHPVEVISRRGGKRDLEAIGAIYNRRGAAAVVVGLPLNMDGSEGPAARAARQFASRLAEHLGCRVELWDERLSSFAAEQLLAEAGLDSRRSRGRLDSAAAAVILKSFLEENFPGGSD